MTAQTSTLKKDQEPVELKKLYKWVAAERPFKKKR